jgi:cytochrome c-type biogenesis protein CcmH
MTIFWTLAAGLMGLAILFVVLPLLRTAPADPTPDQDALNLQVFRQRLTELDGDLASGFLDQSQYDAARHDLERELLCDVDGGPKSDGDTQKLRTGRAPWLAAALALAVPVGAILAYLQLGDSAIINRMEASVGERQTPMVSPDGKKVPPLETLVQGLADRLEQNPDNLDGWLMLGRTYFAIKQPAKALEAMERAYRLAPKQANVIIAYAEALAANNGNSLSGQPAELIRIALDLEPNSASARWLDGMLAYQQERFADAAATWKGILAEIDPAGQEGQQIRQMIAEARNRGGLDTAEVPAAIAQDRSAGPAQAAPQSPPDPAQSNPAAADTGPRIQVAVTLDPALGDKAGPDDVVFVFARAAAGPPMPLAAQRLRVADLPATVILDDGMAVMPAMRLSAFPQVLVGARVSKSGQATPQPGDLEGLTGPVDSAATPDVSVTIDQVRP